MIESTGTQAGAEAAAVEFQPLPSITGRQRWSELGLVILIAIAPLILSATGYLLHPRTGISTGTGVGFATAARFLHEISSLLLVVYFLSRREHKLASLGLGSARWVDLPTGLGLALGGQFVSACFSLFVYWFNQAFTGHPAEMRDPRVIFAGISTGWFVMYAVGSSIFEEVIVRGFVTSEMIALACPVWLATVTSIALQTSYHVYYGFGGALAISGVFTVFGIYFANTRRLLPVILGHLFVDLWATWANHFR